MNDLQKYYETVFRLPNMPEWDDLEKDQISTLKNSLGYDSWRAGNALRDFGLSIEDAINNVINTFKSLK